MNRIAFILACLLIPAVASASIKLDGAASSYGTLADNALLDIPDGDWSFAIWVRIASNAGSDTTYLVDQEGASGPKFRLYVRQSSYPTDGDKICFLLTDDDGGSASVVPPTGTGASTDWQHVVMTRGGAGTFRLYIDGVEAKYLNSTTTDAATITADMIFGAYRDGTSRLTGKIAEAAYWSGTQLSATVIKGLAGIGGAEGDPCTPAESGTAPTWYYPLFDDLAADAGGMGAITLGGGAVVWEYDHPDWFGYEQPAPATPANPSPADGRTNVALSGTTLSWDASDGADTYDVYFGTDSTPDADAGSSELRSDDQAGVTFALTALEPLTNGTTYYWRVDAYSATAGTSQGPVWTLETWDYPAGTKHWVAHPGSGSEDGSDVDNPEAWADWVASPTGAVIIIVGMNSTIADQEAAWPTGYTYVAYDQWYRHGVTLTLDHPYTVGRYCQGDPWAIGPLRVTAFDPASISDATQISTWSDEGDNIWSASPGIFPTTVYCDAQVCTRVSVVGDLDAEFEWWWDRTTDTMYLYAASDPDARYTAVTYYAERNGAMTNPSVVASDTGWSDVTQSGDYDSDDNVALDVDAGSPLDLEVDQTLITSISYAGQPWSHETCIDLAIPFTVVAAADTPSEGDFRPCPYNSDKASTHNISEIQWAKLRSLAAVSGQAALSTVEDYWQYFWLDRLGSDGGRSEHPRLAMEDYGEQMARDIGAGGILLNSNETQEAKSLLCYRFIQYGLDLDGVEKLGGGFYGWGGHDTGREIPIAYARVLLADTDIVVPTDWSCKSQTFLIDQTRVDATYGTQLTGNSYTFRVETGITGTITAGNTLVQATTGATGTVTVVLDTDPSVTAGADDWVQVLWDGVSAEFDYANGYTCTDQTAGGTAVFVYRCRWDLENRTTEWHPDSGSWRDDEIIPYTTGDIGTAEWGIYDWLSPSNNNAYVGTVYRSNTAPAYGGLAVCLVVLDGGQTAFGATDAFLTYTLRYQTWSVEESVSRNSLSWVSTYWDTYWDTYYDAGESTGHGPARGTMTSPVFGGIIR